MLALTLTGDDLAELQVLVEDMRHKDAKTIVGFIQAKQRRAQPAAELPKEAPKVTGKANGKVRAHAEGAAAQ